MTTIRCDTCSDEMPALLDGIARCRHCQRDLGDGKEAAQVTVWILFHETNTGSSDCSDGYVEAVYSTKEAAEAARVATLRELRDKGERIWIDPDDPEDQGSDSWDHDLVVEEHQVL